MSEEKIPATARENGTFTLQYKLEQYGIKHFNQEVPKFLSQD